MARLPRRLVCPVAHLPSGSSVQWSICPVVDVCRLATPRRLIEGDDSPFDYTPPAAITRRQSGVLYCARRQLVPPCYSTFWHWLPAGPTHGLARDRPPGPPSPPDPRARQSPTHGPATARPLGRHLLLFAFNYTSSYREHIGRCVGLPVSDFEPAVRCSGVDVSIT